MLLTGRNLAKAFGPRQLFSGITLGLAEDERIGLIGANGSGKSTLLRIFADLEHTDEGELIAKRNLRVGYVPQEDSFDPEKTCIDCVADVINAQLDDHERHYQAETLLERAGFADPSQLTSALSGGWKKRLAIVRQLAKEPELMLMDEPTNHLDLEGIIWLEDLIDEARFATLTVSHDRRFLEEIADRIIDLDRAYPEGYLSINGTYSEFVEKREAFLASQQGRQQALASNVRKEIAWLRRGAKARTTKSKGRIERANDMMSELADLKNRNTQRDAAKIDFNSSDRKTRKMVQFKNVSKSMGGRELFKDVNFVLSPGSKLGLLGPNGSGKSTMIKLITDQLKPDSGEIFRADQLKVVVFDQHREQLEPTQSLRRALSPTGDVVLFQGESMHISGWARRFLFRNEQLDLPVSELSGGEQARVLIARLMLREADILILDEPTNDLDISTLDVLEESLETFPGALILVTHDRYLLDRISSEILALDGAGNARMHVDLGEWERAKYALQQEKSESKRSANRPQSSAKSNDPAKKKLTWSEQRELENFEKTIHDAEAKVTELQKKVADPKVMSDRNKMHDACEKLGNAQSEVERLYARWTELDARK